MSKARSRLAIFDHVYLSPHLDDAAFSCGGAIAAARDRGERVLVVTVCAGVPPPDVAPPPFIEAMYATAGLTAQEMVRRRRAEDERAMRILGAEYEWSPELDAVFRLPGEYSSVVALTEKVAASDPLVQMARTLARTVAPGALLHAPLGAGGHVDHIVVSDAALATGRPLELYEDFPYAAIEPSAVVRRLTQLGESFAPVVSDIAPTFARKLAAVECYVTQGGSTPRLMSLLEQHARLTGAGVPAERSFRPVGREWNSPLR